MTTKTRTRVIMRPIFFTVVLGIGILVVSNLAIGFWYQKTNDMKDMMETSTNSLHSCLTSQVEMQVKVAPLLYQEFITIPYISQIGYIGLEDSFFSYYYEGNQIYAMYYREMAFYKQPLDSDTGQLNGNATKSSVPMRSIRHWVRETLSSNKKQHSFVSKRWKVNAQEFMFITLAGVHEQGAVLLGISAETVRRFFTSIDLQGGRLHIATRDSNQVVLDGIPDSKISEIDRASVSIVTAAGGNVTCFFGNGAAVVNIEQQEYKVYCSSIELVGVEMFYALAFPNDETEGSGTVHRSRRLAFILLMVMIGVLVISIFGFLLLTAKAAKRVIQLRGALIKQMEATQQAERKSLKKSLGFASASHEIRNLLTPISGFIEDCVMDCSSDSARATNLKAIHDSTKDLISFLSAMLDTSKLEEGKMQLEEKEFSVASVLEDVVDLCHPMAMKKDVDLILDLSHVSILKFSHVIGDRGKLKQVLWNLVSNAVKYTDEGQIVVRARAQQPDLENVIIESYHDGCSRWVSKLVKWNNNGEDDQVEEILSAMEHNPNRIEFVFEVDDSGKGIPKDKQKSIFENYVQVKENSEGQVGTGLGLGIVQSLVRLMGGEIEIVDKENDEKGTCFRFNCLLTVSDTNHNNIRNDLDQLGNEITEDCNNRSFSYPGLCVPSPRRVGSHVVLLIKNEARRRASQKFMENLDIKVTVVEHWEHLQYVLSKMKSNLNPLSPLSSLRKSDTGSRSWNSSAGSKDIPLSAMEGKDEQKNSLRNKALRTGSGFLLLVVDACAGPFEELRKIVTDFKTCLHFSSLKVVWIDKPISRRVEGDLIDPSDEIMLKPFHGAGLIDVIKLLPEYEVTTPARKKIKELCASSSSSSCVRHQIVRAKSSPPFMGDLEIKKEEEQEHDVVKSSIENMPLNGVTFLVVDDSKPVRVVSTFILSKLGAKSEQCGDGVQALDRFRVSLEEQVRNGVSPPVPPYDFILMDCQMPKMDGYESTIAIREEEKRYGIHTPIIGLTGNTSKEELDRAVQAGMDVHLTKPFQRDDILEAVRRIRDGAALAP